VHDLNREPRLPYGDAEFDGAGLCVSVDYLTQPVAVLREAGRVLAAGRAAGADLLQSLLPHQGHRHLARAGRRRHVALVKRMLAEAGNFDDITTLDRSPKGWGDPLYAVIGKAKPAAG